MRGMGHQRANGNGPCGLRPLSPTALAKLVKVKSSQGLHFLEAKKPYAEAAGHGRRGWCARVWSPPPPGLSKEFGER